MGQQDHSVTLAGSALKNRCHACAFFNDPEEEYRLLLPFVREGFLGLAEDGLVAAAAEVTKL